VVDEVSGKESETELEESGTSVMLVMVTGGGAVGSVSGNVGVDAETLIDDMLVMSSVVVVVGGLVGSPSVAEVTPMPKVSSPSVLVLAPVLLDSAPGSGCLTQAATRHKDVSARR